ncbi:MAG: DUF4302 domain-containing protein [Chitinophagaceae bacterium]
MKKIVLCFLVIASLASSCKKENDSVFDQSPDDRLNATLAKYQAQLSGAQNGWKAIVYPAGGGAYSFYFKFNDANRVSMYSDFDSVTAITLKESSFRLKALQQPSIIFDTYSYIHLLADPNEGSQTLQVDVNGGPLGEGLKSDFEFYFDSTTADTIKLVGRYRGSKAVLVRATSQEATAYNSGRLKDGLLINRFLTYFKRVTVGTQLIDIKINPLDRSFTFTYLNSSGAAQTFTTGYYLIAGGIVLINPLVIGTLTISGFNDMVWNNATETISMTVNTVAATIRGVVVPIRADLAAPRRWWTLPSTNAIPYWVSWNGFHVNGVDDGYKVNSLTSSGETYYYMAYIVSFGSGYDFFGPLFLNAAQSGLDLIYGTATRTPTFTADGRAIFSYLGDFPPYPTTGPAALSRAKLYDPNGYYFVQTSATTYDMVNATDGKAWITWQGPQ